MSKVDQPTNCGAWVHPPAGWVGEGSRRVCVLAAGHYTGPDHGTEPGQHAITDDESWHTDCPSQAGQMNPLREHDHEHPSMPHGSCMTWADSASGAHPSDSTVPLPDEDAASIITDAVKESGRSLGTEIMGGYRADVKIGDTGLSVYGPARFVGNVIRAFADAFEEEAER